MRKKKKVAYVQTEILTASKAFRAEVVDPNIICILLAYFPYFEKIKVGL
jgi:hypothetical protein